ncbi:TetR/AcrR family transcriptional regulator [Albidovulum sp.]|uniref:TetR/AcrR family transcriptional regulator n=1 Tax=Albidovulum sp. TaxID=1872424 RepID=UPI001DE6C2E4|nr:TetR/AcrR family transcriptional regulator [Paracoccaceae bacterium]MCB2132502.1 TetR/AcrR family transcriptional regulator [Paracoccaceae bacterium]MCB2152788.1 TetR/AcrR family transcriptional regulator [Paracoccaceae bacterium]HPE24333.1 TetR/AcrR family transcriptional regulator [Albidovulum sp.]HRV61763.1 TetR/AcrR family transcriptional regulator [Albidovulum sp.]
MARPVASDHEDKRHAILKTAARIFADEGYGRASMAQVAAACGISKANIYHYYPGKEALLFDILDSHLRELRDRIVGQEFASNDPEQQLRATVAELLVAYEGADAEHAVQLNAIHALPEAMQEVLRGYQRDLVRFVAARLRDIASPALAADRTRLRAITMSVFAMTNWHYQWDAGADQAARHAYADLICDLITGGLHGLG